MTMPDPLTQHRERMHELALDGIERHSQWLIYSAREIEHYSRLLLRQEPFQTKAEAELERALEALTEARLTARKALADYRALRADQLEAAE